jgi:hypothetical protein
MSIHVFKVYTLESEHTLAYIALEGLTNLFSVDVIVGGSCFILK